MRSSAFLGLLARRISCIAKWTASKSFKNKVDAHIALQKQKTAGLIQITRAYFANAKGDAKVLTRNEYTIIEPTQRAPSTEGEMPADNSNCSIALQR
jgi:hypothetical protein